MNATTGCEFCSKEFNRGTTPDWQCPYCSERRETPNARMSGAVDQEAFENVIRENLSPEGVAALVMALQPAGSIVATTPEGEQALHQVIWFRNTLLDFLGVETFNETIDELGF